MIQILIGGDLCPIGVNLPYFLEGDAEAIFHDLLPDFKESDFSVINLECPLINEPAPIAKYGLVLGIESECIKTFKKAGISALCLGNNHIMDHGERGLITTLEKCMEAGIPTVGAGRNLDEARQMLVRNIKGIRIGVLSVAEHEFSIAQKDFWGANPLDIADFVRNIRENRDKFDYLIVLFHGGNEFYPYPSPRLMDTCRFMAEMGANAVIVQHTHFPGCYEKFNGAYIVYGQGNFIFDKNKKPGDNWNRGFLVKLLISDKNAHSMELLPYVQSEGGAGAVKLAGPEAKKFLKEIQERSSRLSDEVFIKKEWLRFCNTNRSSFFMKLLPGFMNNRIISKLNSMVPFAEHLYSEKHLLRMENLINCESHREVIQTILEEKRFKTSKNRGGG